MFAFRPRTRSDIGRSPSRSAASGAAVLGLATLALGLASPAASAAGSIVFVKDRNVFLVGPEGGTPRAITTDGNDGNAYVSPTAKDDGTIAVGHVKQFSVFAPDGTRLGGPFAAEIMNSGCSTAGPMASQVEPQGSRIVYGYAYHPCFGPFFGYTPTVTYAHLDRPTGQSDFPEAGGYENPRWLAATGIPAGVRSGGEAVDVLHPSGERGLIVEAVPGEGIDSFDVTRDGRSMLLLSSPQYAVSGPGTLRLWQGDAMTGAGATVCELSPFAAWSSKPRWSPDGSAFTWSDDQGVWVSPAPTGAGTCAVSPTLIAPGGSNPSWGAASMPASGGGAVGGGDTPGGGTTPGGNPPSGTTRPVVTLTRPTSIRLSRVLSRGLPLKVRSASAGRISAEAVVAAKEARRLGLTRAKKSVVVARGTRGATAAGTRTVTLRFTKTARRKLRRVSRVRMTLRATVIDSAGLRGTKTVVVTARR